MPRFAPVGESFETSLLPKFATQALPDRSKAIALGNLPTVNVLSVTGVGVVVAFGDGDCGWGVGFRGEGNAETAGVGETPESGDGDWE